MTSIRNHDRTILFQKRVRIGHHRTEYRTEYRTDYCTEQHTEHSHRMIHRILYQIITPNIAPSIAPNSTSNNTPNDTPHNNPGGALLTSSAVFHLASWPRRFCPAQTLVWMILRNSCPVLGLKMKIAPLMGFVVKLPSNVCFHHQQIFHQAVELWMHLYVQLHFRSVTQRFYT